jgi:2-hydroxyacyl-CoA lyase 1
MNSTISTISGAALIAKTLQQLGVKVIFGLVGIPVVQIAEESIKLGIRFIACRNEQAASYGATAYGYLTGKPGVCLVVGGPGVLHAMAGIGNSSANAFPMLLLAGSCETHLIAKGAFQELDAISLLTPHTKISTRATIDTISYAISHAYRVSHYGRAGTGFVDLPADVIQGKSEPQSTCLLPAPPRAGADPERIERISELFKAAKAPLIVIGKGAAYARAETSIRKLVDQTSMPFLPTPMGKGVLPDSHPLNASSARSAALKNADVVLLLGARLNWILHFGDAPKWSADVNFIQVDLSTEEIGHNNPNPELGLVGDINVVTAQLTAALQGWRYDLSLPYMATAIKQSKEKNEKKAAETAKKDCYPLNYHRSFDVIKETIHSLSPPDQGNVVYISEGANTMDISRSVFPVEHPRLRLDAGTYATMGVGLGYAIAAHCAYNLPNPEGLAGPSPSSRKKIVCLEGDSAFGFSMAEVETMARYRMDILIFVMNNGGIYHGDCAEADEWLRLQDKTMEGGEGLRSTSLGWNVGYEKMAEMCGGKGFCVRTVEELKRATEEGFRSEVPVVVNIMIESGHQSTLVSSLSRNSVVGYIY